jgi:dipeptidyl aminopeptidase/acylaminoacyl peptidase
MLVIRSTRDGRVLQRLPDGRYDALRWSPDGRTLAFISRSSRLELLTGSHRRVLWTVHGSMGSARWSPDGRRLAVLVVTNAHKRTGAVEAGAAQVGEVSRVEGQDEQRLAVVPLAGKPQLVSPADTWIYEYDWRPDGRGFVATAARGNGDNNWWVAKLIGLEAGRVRTIAAPSYQMNCPRVSPDGKTVAFIGGLMSDFGSVGGDLYTVPIEGGVPSDSTPTYAGTFTSLSWVGNHLCGVALVGARSLLFRTDGVVPLPSGNVVLSADGRRGAAVSQSFSSPPRLVCGRVGAMVPITPAGPAARLSARSVEWTSDGFKVQGWLLAPRSPSLGRHPLLTVVHGGPAAAWTPFYVSDAGRPFPLQALIDRGTYVFLPNPRGSFGQGEAFTAANRRDFGGGDLRDILAGVDAVLKLAPIDPSADTATAAS